MENKQFPYYVEDWILWLGRHCDNRGNEIDFPYYRSWPVTLANYDVTFIVRSCAAIKKGVGFTDRQIDMAVNIITKYKRQISKKITSDTNYLLDHKPTRLTTRVVDRSYSVISCNGGYLVKFPYQANMVDDMYKLSAQRAGEFTWVKHQRHWFVDKTERNLVLLQKFITSHAKHQWSLDKQFQDHITTIKKICHDHPSVYRPCLELVHNNRLEVFNQTPALTAALENFNFDDDIANAAFRANNYGMCIGPNLAKQIWMQYPNIANILLRSQAEIYSNSQTLNTHLLIQHLDELMKTLRADYWIFLKTKPTIRRTVENFDHVQPSTGKKISYYVGLSNPSGIIIDKIRELNTKEIIIVSNNSMVIARMMNHLASLDILRTIYSHGGRRATDETM